MGGVAIEIDDRQQGGADNAGIRICLYDARERCGDIEVGSAGLLNDLGQFARTETAPPVERRDCCFRRGGVARARVVSGGNIEPRLGLVAGEQAAAERQ